jgi:hypothetical protein
MTLLDFYLKRLQQVPYDYSHNPYGMKYTQGSDISAHIPMLSFVAKDCQHITEFGSRECYSTSAFLMTCPGKVISYDLNIYQDIIELQGLVTTDQWEFRQQDTADPMFVIDETDFLFIDSLHTYEQVKKELLQANKVKRYIGFHDTYSHGKESLDIPGTPGINYAINEFLEANSQWSVVYEVFFNHGLVIIERKI